MAGGISIHAVDVVTGRPAGGMKVEIAALEDQGGRRVIAGGVLSDRGTLDHAVTEGRDVSAGRYEVLFHVGEFYSKAAVSLPSPPFLDVVPFRFGIADAAQHYHLPMKLSPWGFSLFRGG